MVSDMKNIIFDARSQRSEKCVDVDQREPNFPYMANLFWKPMSSIVTSVNIILLKLLSKLMSCFFLTKYTNIQIVNMHGKRLVSFMVVLISQSMQLSKLHFTPKIHKTLSIISQWNQEDVTLWWMNNVFFGQARDTCLMPDDV